jgi:hypothetical protein
MTLNGPAVAHGWTYSSQTLEHVEEGGRSGAFVLYLVE